MSLSTQDVAARPAGDSQTGRRLLKVSSMMAAGLQPTAVLWQQGEMDAQAGTSAEDYMTHFAARLAAPQGMGVDATALVAQSTYWRGDGFGVVRLAQQRLVKRTAGLAAGADTDSLDGAMRRDDCHLSRAGLQKAAELWANALPRADAPTR